MYLWVCVCEAASTSFTVVCVCVAALSMRLAFLNRRIVSSSVYLSICLPQPIWRSGAFLPLLTVHNWNYNSIYAACAGLCFVCYTLLFNYTQCTLENCLSRAGKCCQEWKMQSRCGCSGKWIYSCTVSVCICICICVSLAMPMQLCLACLPLRLRKINSIRLCGFFLAVFCFLFYFFFFLVFFFWFVCC